MASHPEPKLIARPVGRQNRVVLPSEVMDLLGVKEGDFVGFEVHTEKVLLVRMALKKDPKPVSK